MDILTPLHDLTEWVIGPTMQHSHWWFHVVVHMSVVFVPLAFLTLFLALIGHLTGRLRRAVRQKSLSGHPLRYFYRHSRRAQILLLLMALASLPLFYASLELPKTIINEAINGGDFPWILHGFAFDKIAFLLLLSFGYLAAIAGTGYAKFLVNLWQGRLAERMTRRLRLKILRRRRAREAETGQAALIPLLTQEVEPIGGFSGEAFVLPLQQAGTFFTILTFFFLQDPVLAAGALTLVPLQIYLIPRLQKRVNRLARARVREIRRLSHLVSKSGGACARPAVFQSIRRIQEIRFQLYRRKFLIKSLNNVLTGITPFFFYSIGGLLVIDDRLSIGALVAAIAAYKDFSAPLRELLGYYQRYEDMRVRFEEMQGLLVRKG